ncbi:MAG: creatininase family protein [Rhodospirillaceae bacterium]|nr:creatininase family protein [Rhodospirillaceae bacterium]MBT5191497.1 creatininase family protein [Rhodospirillaceae bacterium]MBT5898856.1 creatininase family protein [Rhodospirillaceae bacterium]MBT7759812.1 creatininase family protein [Rhodospirillaceae bacterium]
MVLALGLGTTLADTVYLADMTWPEVRDKLRQGTRTVIVPTGGIEQGGPHLVLGKHNYIVRRTAAAMARALGDALMAPVVTYVPQGSIAPPQGHMRYPGTVSMPESVFQAVLENIARSFKAHGFRQILFLGDSGGNQHGQRAVANQLNKEWAGTGTRVLHVSDYYDPEANGQFAWMRAQGKATAAKSGHGDWRDTSELWAAHARGVRADKIGAANLAGVSGDSNGSSAALGEKMLALKIAAALRQIRHWRAQLANRLDK